MLSMGCPACSKHSPPALGGWRLLFLLRPAMLNSFRLLLLLRSAAFGSWRLLLLRPAVFLLLRPAALGSRLLLLLRAAALDSWRLLLLLRPAALDSCLLLPLLRLSAGGGLQLLLRLRPAALPLLLIRSPALHPRLRLLGLLLFLTLLLMLLLPFVVYWCLTGRREALARANHRWRRFTAAINTRPGRAIARGRLAGPDLSLPILGGRGIHFTFIVFADLRELEGLWFGQRQRHMPAGLGHIDLARK